MKKLTVLSLVLLLLLTTHTQAQKIQHYLSYNFSYVSFFNNIKRNLPLATCLVTPSISYKVQKGDYGLELFGTIGVANYELWNKDQYNTAYLNSRLNTPEYITYVLSGLSFHYLLIDKKWIKVSPNAGLAFGWYNGDRIGFWAKNYDSEAGEWYELITDAEVETKFGASVGINAIVPVYRSLYLNADVKYFTFPMAKYSKNNLLFQVGFGFAIHRDKD